LGLIWDAVRSLLSGLVVSFVKERRKDRNRIVLAMILLSPWSEPGCEEISHMRFVKKSH